MGIEGNTVFGESAMGLGVFVMLAGCVILSAGMSIVIESNSGTGPNDLIAFGWADGSVLFAKEP